MLISIAKIRILFETSILFAKFFSVNIPPKLYFFDYQQRLPVKPHAIHRLGSSNELIVSEVITSVTIIAIIGIIAIRTRIINRKASGFGEVVCTYNLSGPYILYFMIQINFKPSCLPMNK